MSHDITTASVSAANKLRKNLASYTASKAAVIQLTKAKEFVTVLSIEDAFREYFLYYDYDRPPRYMTGTCITVDGGASWGGS